ncbi:imidazoleglycerol-phosphate dehydratase HisB [Desulfofundulus thermocisternus]|uniref:imidazoleglycerol-phosphate dehydratase HisB n=1 Tax=Desulfofundulus thermocisternus TaxID=42471 RepID=UPI0019E0AD86|nr:imidazoleglycerol-phosphate dehydratase HisB [Desulfofundulus thermocisternus]MBE3585711.1 imidazoleglycerol-phosphate dehydratase HisB [Thermoanaerobacter sp.]MCS5696279.1 imidazoleglycerol-phosphate dehydratase HisB [Desulfofundulus thermocisternus]
MQQRVAGVKRRTGETEIQVRLNLDGQGIYRVKTGVGFLDHMLCLFTRHAGFDLELEARGDLEVDAHHTVEDTAICLGRALKEALGNKEGISRYGHALLPMDEALVLLAVDLSGRGYLACEVFLPSPRVGDFDTELVEEFLRALAMNGEFTLHVRLLAGRNTHHIIEAIFKALGRALKAAVALDPRMAGVPSTKGLL